MTLFQCAECQMFLDENCTCFVRDGKTYCRKDYARLFGAKCDKCQHPFGKDDYVMRANKKIFHIKEFINHIFMQFYLILISDSLIHKSLLIMIVIQDSSMIIWLTLSSSVSFVWPVVRIWWREIVLLWKRMVSTATSITAPRFVINLTPVTGARTITTRTSALSIITENLVKTVMTNLKKVRGAVTIISICHKCHAGDWQWARVIIWCHTVTAFYIDKIITTYDLFSCTVTHIAPV